MPRLTRLATLLLSTLVALTALGAQPRRPVDLRRWTWADLRAQADVDTGYVAWLEANVPLDTARQVMAMVAALSTPEDVQMLPSSFYVDGTAAAYRALIDSLAVRPPAGFPGLVRGTYWVARTHARTVARFRGSGYPLTFTGQAPPKTPARAAAPDEAGRRVRLAFRFDAADTVLSLLATPDVTPADAARRLSVPPFDALLQHRSQSFYPTVLSRERLATLLAHAASTRPLDALYRYMMPLGLYHFAEARAHLGQFRALLATLRANERVLLAPIEDSIATLLPRGVRVERTVHLFIAADADGWAATVPGRPQVAAVDVEWFKDDYPRLLNTMLHETFHAAQSAIRATLPPPPLPAARTPGDSALFQALGTLFVEGTANYVAPAHAFSDSAAAAAVDAGRAILRDLERATRGSNGTSDRARADSLLNAGVASGGPFYSVGAVMAREIARQLGRTALADALAGNALGYARTYLRATRAPGAAPPVLDSAIVARLAPYEP